MRRTPGEQHDRLDTAAPRTYTKYAAHVTRDFFLGAFQKVHVNGSYFGGSRLDRFSRYQFGLFDDTRSSSPSTRVISSPNPRWAAPLAAS